MHVLPHSLKGMMHDFKNSGSRPSRTDSKGKKCKNIAAFMVMCFKDCIRLTYLKSDLEGSSAAQGFLNAVICKLFFV